jgi:hypothetical protein
MEWIGALLIILVFAFLIAIFISRPFGHRAAVAGNVKSHSDTDETGRHRSSLFVERDRIHDHTLEPGMSIEGSKGGDVMTYNEKLLLENMLDALDRLFDRQSSAIEVWALLFATGEALRTTPHYPEIKNATSRLKTLIGLRYSSDLERDFALEVTDDLRHYLASLPLN